MPRISPYWKQVTITRVQNVLRSRRICCLKTLESKISEAGPKKIRAQTIVISDVLRNMLKYSQIQEIPMPPDVDTTFYALPDFDRTQEKDRYQKIVEGYRIYRNISKDERYCSKVSEIIIFEAVLKAQTMHCIGDPRKNDYPLHVNGYEIIDKSPLDLILYDKKTGIRIGIEVKNRRDWIYPDKDLLWRAIGKCVSIKALPVFICREIPYVSFIFFKWAGILGYPTHNQYFHPDKEQDLQFAKSVDGLGFHDIYFPQAHRNSFKPEQKIEQRHVHFFRNILPSQVSKFYDKFLQNFALLEKYALKKGLFRKDLALPQRRKIYGEFISESGFGNVDWYQT